ncbi:MAG: hypothetical protein PHN74_02965 [Candidatus Pacebacteria bacterium]|nr:hypothetical protein [Candidatus Paceibacterota bacterium]
MIDKSKISEKISDILSMAFSIFVGILFFLIWKPICWFFNKFLIDIVGGVYGKIVQFISAFIFVSILSFLYYLLTK